MLQLCWWSRCFLGGLMVLAAAAICCGEEKPRIAKNSLGMKFIAIPAGKFQMGDEAGEFDERPAHSVEIRREFFLGIYEVTQAEYERITGDNPSHFGPHGAGRADVAGKDTSQFPVDNIAWVEAVAFCRALSDLPDERAARRKYRLPTEAEWEYACRAGTKTAFSTGETLKTTDACIDAPLPRPVGSFPANPFGLHDMHGNVWEWCDDAYFPEAYTPAADHSTEGTGRVIRGGAWNFGAGHARSANRDFTRATRRDIGNGFRLVLE